jgi:hypothetical protein
MTRRSGDVAYDPRMDSAVITTAIGVGGTVVVGVSGFWASVKNTSQTVASARQSKVWDRREAQRAEVKSSIASYLEVAQHLQTQLYAREHGQRVPDLPIMVEQLWLAQKQVDILCSEELRKPLEKHALALNEVARHEEAHPDWWEFVSPYSEALLNAMRAELKFAE